MKSIWALGAALCLLQLNVNAIQISFANTTASSTAMTVDWTDGLLTGTDGYNFDKPDGWNLIVDRASYPQSYLNFTVFPEVQGWFFFALWWLDPSPTAITFDHYTITDPAHVRVSEQTATSIIIDMDREGFADRETTVVAAPDTAGTLALLCMALAPILVLWRKFH